jgi:hypothetical protein
LTDEARKIREVSRLERVQLIFLLSTLQSITFNAAFSVIKRKYIEGDGALGAAG